MMGSKVGRAFMATGCLMLLIPFILFVSVPLLFLAVALLADAVGC